MTMTRTTLYRLCSNGQVELQPRYSGFYSVPSRQEPGELGRKHLIIGRAMRATRNRHTSVCGEDRVHEPDQA